MQLVYQITWLVIPNCDLNMTICHPYLFRFDRFISKYFLDDAYDTFDDVILSCCEDEILKISYRAYHRFKDILIFITIQLKNLKYTKIAILVENAVMLNSHGECKSYQNGLGLYFLNDFNLTV